MNADSNPTLTISVSGTLTISRSELEELLSRVMSRQHQAEPSDGRPRIEAARPKPAAKGLEQPQRLAFSIKETADALGVSYASVYRLLQRGLLKSSRALRARRIPMSEIERYLKETKRISHSKCLVLSETCSEIL